MEDWPSPSVIQAAIGRGDVEEMADLEQKVSTYIQELETGLVELRQALERSSLRTNVA